MKSIIPVIIGSSLIFAACSEKKSHDQPIVDHDHVTEVVEKPMGMPRSSSAKGAKVQLIEPKDGAIVSNPIAIEFGVNGTMVIVKAGTKEINSGHHHLLIDTELPAMHMPIPADDHHIHFGDGSIKTEINLEPGEHTLQAILGDHLHVPHDPPLFSEKIMITVK